MESISIQKSHIHPNLDGCGFQFYGLNQSWAAQDMLPPSTITSLDPLRWVNEYTQTALPIEGPAVEPILYFSLMWNLFERDVCGKGATRTKIGEMVGKAHSAGLLSLESFFEHLTYFQQRSQRDGMPISDYLDAIKMDKHMDRTLVYEVLSGGTQDTRKIVHALLLVAHRIRNNLFHGEKDVAYLHSQVELFRAVNSLLATYLGAVKGAT